MRSGRQVGGDLSTCGLVDLDVDFAYWSRWCLLVACRLIGSLNGGCALRPLRPSSLCPAPSPRWAPGSRAGSVSVAVAVGVGVGWLEWRGRRGVGGPCTETRGGHKEVLYALAGDLSGGVIDEGVEEMPVVAHLLPVGIGDH